MAICPRCGHTFQAKREERVYRDVVPERCWHLERTARKLAQATAKVVDRDWWELWLAPLAVIEARSGLIVVGGSSYIVKSATSAAIEVLLRVTASELAELPIAVELHPAVLPPSVRSFGELLESKES